ncbi:hypothetical protein D3C74_307390 [compost metagenome]
MDKVILTKVQVESIESKIKNHPRERVIRDFVTATKANGSLDGITLDMLNRALYIGYEIEQTPQEKIAAKVKHLPSIFYQDEQRICDYHAGMLFVLETFGLNPEKYTRD